MLSIGVWYCCKCTFGPHNSRLHDDCIQCGAPRCTRCTCQSLDEAPQASQASPKRSPIRKPSSGDKSSSPRLENNAEIRRRPTGNRKGPQRQAAMPSAEKIDFSSGQSSHPQKRIPWLLRSGGKAAIQINPSSGRDLPAWTFNDITESLDIPTFHIVYSSSLGSMMADWVFEQFSQGLYSSGEVQVLRKILIELKNTEPKIICMRTKDPMSKWNAFQGKVEGVLGGTVDWWPFHPYMAPLSEGEVRLSWDCNCGDPRWAVVPKSFGTKISHPSVQNATQPSQEKASRNDVSLSNESSINGNFGMKTRSQTVMSASQSGLPRSAVEHQSPASAQITHHQRHAFLVFLNSSILGNVHYLAQTDVHNMNDQEFFTWLQNSYHSQRGFFAIWFDLFRFSHCEFFRVSSHGIGLHFSMLSNA
ncbi:unnamed protein product [Penicillium olsonii]|nr:unnamed protein product [Penicillium olsonii]CAG7923454.1 unnamed protein product [Penicillium olsonii]